MQNCMVIRFNGNICSVCCSLLWGGLSELNLYSWKHNLVAQRNFTFCRAHICVTPKISRLLRTSHKLWGRVIIKLADLRKFLLGTILIPNAYHIRHTDFFPSPSTVTITYFLENFRYNPIFKIFVVIFSKFLCHYSSIYIFFWL